MIARELRRRLARWSRLCVDVEERPHDHVVRERLFHAIGSTTALLSSRKRPRPRDEATVLLQRLTTEAEAVCDCISSARQQPLINAALADRLVGVIRKLKGTVCELLALPEITSDRRS